jgi:uncharacterized linocin/CFP29 family protein
MDNLHRELAPISSAAWEDLEAEARRTFGRYIAGRRAVDLIGPGGEELAAVGTGHRSSIEAPEPGVLVQLRRSQPLLEVRVPFTVDRQTVDDVSRGAKDADWQPVKEAAQQAALFEDRVVFDGFADAHVTGIRTASSNRRVALPPRVVDYPNAVAQALTELRLAGVSGPYRLLLSADAYTAVAETTDHGYPIREHLVRVLGGDSEIIWAPALSGALLLSARGGDYELYLGQDLSIGYLSHNASAVELYFQESLTFLVQTTEAGVVLTA